jgi:predicted hydrolase (HD superfamily)
MKDKGFARTVNRDDITKGAEIMELDLDEHIDFVIDSLKPFAKELGIAGQ